MSGKIGAATQIAGAMISGLIRPSTVGPKLEWVIANKERYQIRVVNISLGGDDEVPYERNAVDQAAERAVNEGLVVVVASGNAGCTERYRPVPPANAPSVITVGGYDDKNQIDSRDFDLYCSRPRAIFCSVILP